MSKKRNPSSSAIAAEIMKNYKPETVEDMQDALKDIFRPLFEAMLEGELDTHLGYENTPKKLRIQVTDVMELAQKLLKPLMEKSGLTPPEIGTVPLNLSL